MNRIVIPIIIVIVMVAGYLIISKRGREAPPAVVELALPPQPQTPLTPEPPPTQYPVPEPVVTAEPVEPLPQLDESDTVVEQKFSGLTSGDAGFAGMLLFNAFVRNFVVIVDNLPEPKIPQKYMFVKPPAGTFLVNRDEAGNNATIAPDNQTRYRPFVNLVAALDTGSLINVYVYLYPLFQQAYAELGYPDRYFNDRLVEVIDHLLQAPEPADPIALVQPKVYYQYADPALESRSAGQKLLMRIGSENAAPIKQKLREIRAKLTTLRDL